MNHVRIRRRQPSGFIPTPLWTLTQFSGRYASAAHLRPAKSNFVLEMWQIKQLKKSFFTVGTQRVSFIKWHLKYKPHIQGPTTRLCWENDTAARFIQVALISSYISVTTNICFLKHPNTILLYRNTKMTNTLKWTWILTDRNKIHYAVDQSKPPWNGKRMPSWLRTKERNREVVKVQMSSRFSHRLQWCRFGGDTRVDKGSGLRKQTQRNAGLDALAEPEAFYRGPTGKGLHCARDGAYAIQRLFLEGPLHRSGLTRTPQVCSAGR